MGLITGVFLLAACSSDGSEKASDPSPAAVIRSYVGTAQGTAAFIGVVVDGSRAVAYVCDGVPGDPVGTTPTVQQWFNGSSDGSAVDVEQEGARLRLELTDTEMTGTLALADGRQVPITGRAVTGDAGLYRAEAAGGRGGVVAGWILTQDGQQRGGVGGLDRSPATVSGTRVLNLAQPTFTFQGVATARIARVGITPIPIP